MDMFEFKQLPLMGILRGIGPAFLSPLLELIISSGMRTIEITMNTADAPQLIKKAVALSRGRLTIGAGTVLDMASLDQALDSGASFIVMPVLIGEVVDFCVKKNIPVFPGAFTPQEVFRAWESGASMVKVFPAGFFGPRYFKELKGPFERIALMAVGGVSADNAADFFQCGAQAVAVGGSILNPQAINAGELAGVERGLAALVSAVKRGVP